MEGKVGWAPAPLLHSQSISGGTSRGEWEAGMGLGVLGLGIACEFLSPRFACFMQSEARLERSP